MRLILIFLLFLTTLLSAQNPGDTTIIQAFTFGSVQDAEIDFPTDGKQYEKILMHYTLKCVPGGAGGLQYPCGEWDYLTHTYLYHPTGIMDSNELIHANFLVNKDTMQSFHFMVNRLYDLEAQERTENTYDIPMNEEIHTYGVSDTEIDLNLTKSEITRLQIILSPSELLSYLDAQRNITGIALNINNPDGNNYNIKRLKVELGHSSASNNTELLDLTGAINCYDAPWMISENNLHKIVFNRDFVWDGNSSIVVNLSFESSENIDLSLFADQSVQDKTTISTNQDKYLELENTNHIEVQNADDLFIDVDEEITISFWSKGDESILPANTSIIEGLDSKGNRIVNIHLPWSNGNIYWDAGVNSTNNYDRIEKAAPSTYYEGQWNHYAFTKNTNTGAMKIYINGNLWHSGTSKTRSMRNIDRFVIGSSGQHSNYFPGSIDEFSVWSKELTRDEIREIIYSSIQSNHPYFSDLIINYDFNNQGYIVQNKANGLFDGEMYGVPSSVTKSISEQNINLAKVNDRPILSLLTSTYMVLSSNTVTYLDTIWLDPVAYEKFNDSEDPSLRTSLDYVWPAQYTFVYDEQGDTIRMNQQLIADSDNTYMERSYYSDAFEIVDQFELGRYITPYGINLDLGSGWTWVYDVTDYMTILRDKKRLSAGNWQEHLDLKFLFIEGTPPRDIHSIRNLQTAVTRYRNSTDANEFLMENEVEFNADTKMVKLKIRNSGHGFGGNLNCSEFCPRTNEIRVNGSRTHTQYLWRDDCAENPLHPQGGTWVYDRANWCPGAEVTTDEYELTEHLDFTVTNTIDYHLQDNYTWNGAGSTPTYIVNSQLVDYGDYNHETDLRIEEILAPNDNLLFSRHNPICGEPEIIVKNTGSAVVTSFSIKYGLEGINEKTEFIENVNLNFNEELTVSLPVFTQGTWPDDEAQVFFAMIELVNGKADDYSLNDRVTSNYTPSKVLPSSHDGIIIEVGTNNLGNETSYTLTNANGTLMLDRDNLSNNTTYRDTFYLEQGCYEFKLKDSGQDGLQWWANSAQGSGFVRVRGLIRGFGVAFKGFDNDFGSFIDYNFSVGDPVANGEELEINEWGYNIYPNPSNGDFSILLDQFLIKPVTVTINSSIGAVLYSKNYTFDSVIDINNLDLPNGLYWLTVSQEEHKSTKKLIIHNK